MLTYGPGRAARWPRTRQPGTRATDRGPGSAALVFVNLGPGSQTPAALDHKHKHDQAAAARPGSHRQQLRDQLGRQPPGSARQPPAPGTRTTDQAALGSHQAARTWQQITAAAALTWQQITARAAVSGQQITANQAARPTAQAATGSSCRARTRQQLRTIRAPGFTRPGPGTTGQARPVARASG